MNISQRRRTRMVIGCGYLGSRVARAWRTAGDEVIVGVRSSAKANDWISAGFKIHRIDVLRSETVRQLPAVDTLLYAVAFDRREPSMAMPSHGDAVKHLLPALTAAVQERFIFASSTGVYGQTDGEWVDEASACDPMRSAGQDYLTAERAIQSHVLGGRAVILRLAGIYGPDRIPHLDRLRQGQPVPVAKDGYLNLIHVDDAVRLVLALDSCRLPNLLLVSDGQPVLRGDFYREVARQLGVEARFVPPPPSSSQAIRAQGSKRVRNSRLISELDLRLEYPNYRLGVASILGPSAGTDVGG